MTHQIVPSEVLSQSFVGDPLFLKNVLGGFHCVKNLDQ